MNMRDKIAEILEQMPEEMNGWEDAADVILTTLPDMIAPLVWVEDKDGRGFVALSVLGQYGCFDEGNPRWYSPGGSVTYRYTDTLEQAQAAANAHHRAAIMAAFTGENT